MWCSIFIKDLDVNGIVDCKDSNYDNASNNVGKIYASQKSSIDQRCWVCWERSLDVIGLDICELKN